MAQKQLNIPIVLQGRVDNSVGKLGTELTALGHQIDEIGSSIRNLGMESLTEFMGYDDIMRVVDHIGGYSSETMKELDAYNKTIAQTSRYNREQAASAELLMARLGLDLGEIQTMLPTVMDTATAANISMADSLDYLYYSLQALDQPMSYASVLSDQMAKAADISAADIDGLGQSLQRLGSGAQFFAGGSGEILALLAGISRFGKDMQGAEAGTRLRNFMMTLLAPTTSKEAILESFGVGEEAWAEFESYMTDAEINITETADAMNELGLSVYDSATGELKPAIQILGELNAALDTMGDEEKNKALGRLFGLRTTTTALNLMEALPTIIDYYDQIVNGSSGYTKALSEATDGGLGGAIRELNAAWSDLKTTFGESIAPEAEKVADFLSDAASALSNIDPAIMEGLTTGLGSVAAAGSGLLLAGGGLKVLGLALTPGGALVTGLAAAAGIAATIAELDKTNWANGFGIMELDTAALDAHLNAIEQSFKESYTEVDAFEKALENAAAGYQEASEALSSQLLTTAITGATLTESDITSLQSLGTTMGNRLLDGIKASFDESSAYLSMLGGDGENAKYGDAFILSSKLQEDMLREAEEMGKSFGTTLGEAMDDGIITGDEYNTILRKMQEYNEAMAFTAQLDREGNVAKQLFRAQSVGWDSASDFLSDAQAQMEAQLAEIGEEHAAQAAQQKLIYEESVRRGLISPEEAETQLAALLSRMEKDKNTQISQTQSQYDNLVMTTLDAMLYNSEHADAWTFLRTALGGIEGMERDHTGSLTLADLDWAGLEAAGILKPGMGNMLYDLSGGAGKIRKVFEPFASIPAVAKALEQMDYMSALATESDMYFLNKENPVFYVEDALVESTEAGLERSEAILAENPGEWIVNVSFRKTPGGGVMGAEMVDLDMFAQGGRATEASIFGEAGAEWAIPEEHTANTANLLLRAAEASGFTWHDIGQAAGGSKSSSSSTTLVYAPTIVANDATGVAEKLREDKERFERWLKDRELKDAVSVYA